MPKKNEKADDQIGAKVVDPSELVSGNNPSAGENPPEQKGAEAVKETEAEKTGEPAQPVAATPPPAENQNAPQPINSGTQTVTPEQLVSENIPAAPILPPPPGSEKPTKRGRGRPFIPLPECKKCGRKHLLEVPCPGSAQLEASNVVIPTIPTDQPAPAATTEPEKPAVNHRQLAEIVFDLTTNGAAGFFGPEWKASDAKEREGVILPLEIYLRSKQVDDIPPGALLALAIVTYSAPRLQAPKTREKLSFGWTWLKMKWAARKRKAKPENVIPANSDQNPFAEKN